MEDGRYNQFATATGEPPEIPPTSLRVSQTGFGVKLQLDLTVGQNLDGSLIERQLLRAFCSK
jgi:hypothetical protein